jgi:hypothetical protein
LQLIVSPVCWGIVERLRDVFRGAAAEQWRVRIGMSEWHIHKRRRVLGVLSQL